MEECFVSKKFSAGSKLIIEQAVDIIDEYREQGYTLTLRQLYYQFVSRDIIANKMTEYKRLGSIINDARLAGQIDWDAIEDRTRNLQKLATWETPSDVIDSALHSYREDWWESQNAHVEVWIEKDALVGVIEKVCRDYRVPFFACRGNVSQSEQYSAGKRFAAVLDEGRTPIVLHLGDHDPSGIDMTRDNEDRLSMFAREGVEVRRLALNMNQVKQYNPPPNPAKQTDSRFTGYAVKYGTSSWELDALEPRVISQLVKTELDKIIEPDEWMVAKTAENKNKEILRACSSRWEDVAKYLSKKGS